MNSSSSLGALKASIIRGNKHNNFYLLISLTNNQNGGYAVTRPPFLFIKLYQCVFPVFFLADRAITKIAAVITVKTAMG